MQITQLGKTSSKPHSLATASQADEAADTLPTFLEPMLVEQYGEELSRRIIRGYSVRRASSLRANALRSTRDEVQTALGGAGIAWRPVSWYDDAFLLESPAGGGDFSGSKAGSSEKRLWELPVYDEGKIYLQSLSSMLPPLVLGAQPGIDILDMCAAPGGKTTQLAALGGKGAHITACEMHAPRAEKLEYNLRKQGAENVVVMHVDARLLDDFFRFDRILLDAPCSGSGTLRAHDPKLHARFTPKLIQKSCKSQRALLDKALTLLKPGGTLVYSTCSVLRCENEDAVLDALRKAGKFGSFKVEPIDVPGATRREASLLDGESPSPDILPVLPTTLEGSLCICPTDLFEGFFVTKIRRRA